MKTILGLFDTAENALSAQNELLAAGIARDRISIIAKPINIEKNPNLPLDQTEALKDAEMGAASGALAGGAAGILAGLGLLTIPGVGLIALGPILAALTGAGVGAAAGGLIGGLVGSGVPEPTAEIYTEGVNRGGTLLTVECHEADAQRIALILSQHGAIDIDKRASEWETAGWQRHYTAPTEKSALTIDPKTRGLERGADAAESIRQSTGGEQPNTTIGTTRRL